jgi:hypothetical protein
MVKANALPEIHGRKRSGGEEALNDVNLVVERVDNHDFKRAGFAHVSQVSPTSRYQALKAETNHLPYFGMANFFGLVLDFLPLLFAVSQVKETFFHAQLFDCIVIKCFHPCSDLHCVYGRNIVIMIL